MPGPWHELRVFRGKVLGLEQALWEWYHDRPEGRFIHSSLGHESAPFCLSRVLEPGQALYALYYRSHAWLMALGVAPEEIATSISRTGARGAKLAGTPMHLYLHPAVVDCNSIVGAQIPIAIGAALASRDRQMIVVCVLGDGATTSGIFFEALNVAVLQHAPLLLVIEDNYVAIESPYATISCTSISEKLGLFGIPFVTCEASRPDHLLSAASDMVRRARTGPAALHVRGSRMGAHALAFQQTPPRNELNTEHADSSAFETTRQACSTVLRAIEGEP